MNSLNFLKQALTAPESLLVFDGQSIDESTEFGGLLLSVRADTHGVAVNLKEITEHENLTLVRTVFFLGTELGGEKPVLSVSIIDAVLANRLLELLEERLSPNAIQDADFVDIPAVPADAAV